MYIIKRAIEKNKKYIIIYLLLWLILTIVFIMPLSCSIKESLINGNMESNIFIDSFNKSITNPINCIGKSFKTGYFDIFIKSEKYFSILYVIVFVIGIVKSKPKNDYTDIEHGSSDWSESGEQYKVLSKKEGIILAEDNYLPLDKIGNTNVLIVGRFRFW